MIMWKNLASVLEGEIVRLEPLACRHEEQLFEAAQDERVWRWMHYDAGGSRERFHAWLEDALAASSAGTEAAFATVDAATGEPVGSTRYLAFRPEHLGLEIGWTWLAPTRWQTGANVEAKTDSRNERSRAALAALPAKFEGIFRKHMLVRGGERRDSDYYSIIDDEWPEVRENLARRINAIRKEGAR